MYKKKSRHHLENHTGEKLTYILNCLSFLYFHLSMIYTVYINFLFKA